MKYSEPLQTQLYTTLVFSGTGFLLGIWYDACAFLRQLFGGGKVVTFILDILFCFGAFFALFSCALGFTDGVWRIPALCFSALGFFLYQISVGHLLRRPLSFFALFLRNIADAAIRPVRALSAMMYRRFSGVWQHLIAGLQKLWAARKCLRKKSSKKEKNNAKSLENRETILYNKY